MAIKPEPPKDNCCDDLNYMTLRFKICPKFGYFLTNGAIIGPVLYFSWDKLTESKQGIIFLVFYFLVTLATYAQYLRTALCDPGYIKTLSFNRP